MFISEIGERGHFPPAYGRIKVKINYIAHTENNPGKVVNIVYAVTFLFNLCDTYVHAECRREDDMDDERGNEGNI